MFNSVINAFNLRELYMSGDFFTWSNNQLDPTLEKLDRILVTKDWEGLFPTALVQKKLRELSDHNPLILSSDSVSSWGNREFRFEVSWLGQVEFLPKVNEIWLAPTRDNVALDRVQFKLKKMKIFLKGWGYNLAGSRKKRKLEIEKLIKELEDQEESGPFLWT
jgi:hypothetical protein